MSHATEALLNAGTDWLSGLNPAQREAVEAPLSQNVQVLAGAGTGKTKMLSHRAVFLAKQLLAESPDENPFEKLFIATFSDKAASHLYDSIESLWQAEMGTPLPTETWIGTLHSMSFKILKAYNKQKNILPKEILSKLDQLTIQEEFIQLLLSYSGKELAEQLSLTENVDRQFNLLDPDYWLNQGITDIEKLLTDIVLYLIPQIKAAGLSPKAFLALADEQTTNFLQTLETLPLTDKQTGQTFLGVTDWVSAWESHLKPYAASNWQLYPSQWELTIETIKAEGRKNKKPKTESNMVLTHIRKIAKAHYLDYNASKKIFTLQTPTYTFETERKIVDLEKKLIRLTALLYEGYQNLLQSENVCDFDDILLDILKFAGTDNGQKLIPKPFRHYLIDEFQDTNGAQLALIQLLSNKTTPVTVVGDIKQSIYGFRYAQPENLSSIFSTRQDILKVTLAENYRSHAGILRLANQVANFLELEAKHHHLNAKITLTNDTQKCVEWNTIEAPQIGGALSEQNSFIQKRILELTSNTNYQYQDIAILVPGHQHAWDIEQVLKQADIPAIRQKSLGFFGNPLMLALSHWLQWLVEPYNNMALIGWLQYSFSPEQLIKMGQASRIWNKEKSYTDYLTQTKSIDPTITQMALAIGLSKSHFQALAPHLAIEKLNNFSEKNSLFLNADFMSFEIELQSLHTVLLHWYNAIKKTDNKPAHVMQCLKRAMSQNELELPVLTEDENRPNAVQILTTHASKGLEFPVVFLAGVESHRKTRLSSSSVLFEPQHDGKAGMGVFLANYQNNETLKRKFYKTIWHTPQRLKENLNLMYVAVTRAKEKLIITHWQKSFDYLNPMLMN